MKITRIQMFILLFLHPSYSIHPMNNLKNELYHLQQSLTQLTKALGQLPIPEPVQKQVMKKPLVIKKRGMGFKAFELFQ